MSTIEGFHCIWKKYFAHGWHSPRSVIIYMYTNFSTHAPLSTGGGVCSHLCLPVVFTFWTPLHSLLFRSRSPYASRRRRYSSRSRSRSRRRSRSHSHSHSRSHSRSLSRSEHTDRERPASKASVVKAISTAAAAIEATVADLRGGNFPNHYYIIMSSHGFVSQSPESFPRDC